MADPYHNPEKFGLKIEYEADAGSSYEFDKLVLWSYLHGSDTILMGTDSGCSCPSPFDGDGIGDLDVATPEAINEWFDSPKHSPRRDKLGAGERQDALSVLDVKVNTVNLDSEIRETEAKLDALKARKALEKQTPEMEVASKLHGLMCHSDHAEACGWFYEMDNKIDRWTGTTHARFLVRAKAIVSEIGSESAIKFLDVLERTKA